MRGKPVPIKVPRTAESQHSKMDSHDADEFIIHTGGNSKQSTWSGNEVGFSVQENVSGANIELQLMNNQAKQQRLMTVVLQKRLLNFNVIHQQQYRQKVLEKEKRKQIAQESAVKEAESMQMPKNSKNEIVLTNQPKSLDRLESMQAHSWQQRNEKPATTLLYDKVAERAEQTRQSKKLSRNPEQINRVKSDGSLKEKKQTRANVRSKRRDVVTEKDPTVREKSTTYSCENCNKAFTHKGNLIAHSRIHSGEKPFKCGECGMCFRQKRSLISHERVHSERNLSRHLLIHTSERPFSCDICKQSFRQKATLSVHMNIHSGNRPHKCKVCPKTYRQRSSLYRHRKFHAETTLQTKQFLCEGSGFFEHFLS